MKFTQSLVDGVREKFRRPSVVAALLGYPTTGSEASYVGAVLSGKRALPVKWAARFAEILDMDPEGARVMVENERKASGKGSHRARSDVVDALSAYPLAKSRALGSWIAKS